MRFILILYFLILSGCTTVEVTKEVIKAGSSVKTSVSAIISEKSPESSTNEDIIYKEPDIEEEKENINIQKKAQKTIFKNQQKTAQINFIGDSIYKIEEILGKPELERVDGNTFMMRYDSDQCRLFLFFNNKLQNKQVEHFEIRDVYGVLLESKNSIEQCYREFNLS